MRNLPVGDVRLVGCIVENDGLFSSCVGDPFFELSLRRYGAGGVVWKAEIDQIDMLAGKRGDEMIGCSRGHVNQSGKSPACVCRSRSSGHDVGVDVYRI